MLNPESRTATDARPIEIAELVVSVGTDHHRFDRLIDWIDEWRDSHENVVAVVQAGSCFPSRHDGSRPLVPHDELLTDFANATAVVCHGGPGTVMDARMSGRLPIVVPRNPVFGEHVDEHQMRFAEHLDRHGVAIVVHDKHSLFAAIDRAFADPDSFAVAVEPQAAVGVAQFGQAVDRLLGTKTPIEQEQVPEATDDSPTEPELKPRTERRRVLQADEFETGTDGDDL